MFHQLGMSQSTSANYEQITYDSLLSPQSFKPVLHFTSKNQNDLKFFRVDALPIFCKIEHKIESVSKIAFRFRLGELNYVNMLENKQ